MIMWGGDRQYYRGEDSETGMSGGRVATPFAALPSRRPTVSGKLASRRRRHVNTGLPCSSATRRYGHQYYDPRADCHSSGYRYNVPCETLHEEAEFSRRSTPLPPICSRSSLTSSHSISRRRSVPASLPPSGLVRLPPIGAEVYVMQKSDLELLREEIEEEEVQRDAIQKSLADLGESVKGQKHAVESNIRPGGEWKIRYEGQVKTNEGLDEEFKHLEEQVEMSERRAREGMSSKAEIYPDLTDAEVRQFSRTLDKTKADLQRRVKDYEWRLDSESNAFHRANEEREKLILQVAEISKSIHQASVVEADKAAKELVHQRLVDGQSASTTPTPKTSAVTKQRKSIPGRVDPPPGTRQKPKPGLSTTPGRK